jgi:rod shape-determining protein MreC
VSSRTGTWALGVIFLSLALILLSRTGLLNPLQDTVLSIAGPMQHGLRNMADPVAGWLSNINDVGNIRSENDQLRKENEQLRDEISRLTEAQMDLQQLQALLQVRDSYPDEQFIGANVLAKEPNSMKEAVAIDRGKRDGLREGMVVVTEGHSVVGTITKVLDSYSWVTLITDPSSAVSAMVQESRSQGVVAGSYSRRLSIEFLDEAQPVKNGDVVVTSSIGGLFPPGLVIGRVTDVSGTAQDLFKKVTVEPLASLSHLETVLVLTSFQPTHLESP